MTPEKTWVTLMDGDDLIVARRVGVTTYHLIKLIEWEDWVGEREAKEIGAKYNVELAEVDIADETQRTTSLRSCGFMLDAAAAEGSFIVVNEHDGGIIAKGDAAPGCIAEAMFSYGAKAPLLDQNGNNRGELLREAKRSSRVLDDPEQHESAMARPVNALGSTAHEFARGDLMGPVLRGVAEGDPKAELMLKMYVAAGGQTLGGTSWSREPSRFSEPHIVSEPETDGH